MHNEVSLGILTCTHRFGFGLEKLLQSRGQVLLCNDGWARCMESVQFCYRCAVKRQNEPWFKSDAAGSTKLVRALWKVGSLSGQSKLPRLERHGVGLH